MKVVDKRRKREPLGKLLIGELFEFDGIWMKIPDSLDGFSGGVCMRSDYNRTGDTRSFRNDIKVRPMKATLTLED